jgi:hypothetical protein
MIEQHREWVIRSYVVTFGFVTFRALVTIFEIVGIGTLQEQLVAASWLCWAGPLFITETVLQGRKVLGRERKDDSLWEVRDFASTTHSWAGLDAGISMLSSSGVSSVGRVPPPEPPFGDTGGSPMSKKASTQS